MAAQSIQARTAWQPNPFGSVSIGVFATVIMLAAFVFIFSRPLEPAVHPVSIVIRLISLRAAKLAPRAERIRPTPQIEHVWIAIQPRIVRPEKIQLPKSVDWRQQLNVEVKTHGQSRSQASQFMMNPNPPDEVLEQALQAPRKPATLQNEEAYRNIYGGIVVKSNGVCSELQTIQIGPSPSSRTTVALPGHCSGDHQPSMDDELSAWATRQKKKRQLRL